MEIKGKIIFNNKNSRWTMGDKYGISDAEYYGTVEFNGNNYLITRVTRAANDKQGQVTGKFLVVDAMVTERKVYLDQQQSIIAYKLEIVLNNGRYKSIEDILQNSQIKFQEGNEALRKAIEEYWNEDLAAECVATVIEHEEFLKKLGREDVKQTKKKEEIPEGEILEEEIPEGEILEEEILEEEIPEGEILEEEIPEEEIPEEEIPEGEILEEEIPEGEILEEEIPEGEILEGEILEGEIPVEEIPEGEIPVEEIPEELEEIMSEAAEQSILPQNANVKKGWINRIMEFLKEKSEAVMKFWEDKFER